MIDELEGVDGLDFAIFEQLEVVLRQTEDRLAVARRVGIDPDVVRAGSKGRRRTLRIGLLILSANRQHGQGEHDRQRR